jgi:phosphoinositide-3-kinase regulatory subunit 4
MTEEEEDKLLALKDFMMKSNRAKANAVDQSHLHDSSQKGVIDLAALGITGRQVDLVKTKQEPDEKRGEYISVCTLLFLAVLYGWFSVN